MLSHSSDERSAGRDWKREREATTTAGARGTPDMAIEVLSPSTHLKDLREKFDLYQRMGVREYWIIDPAVEWINRFVLCQDGRYGEPELREPIFKKGPIVSEVLKGFQIESTEIFAAE